MMAMRTATAARGELLLNEPMARHTSWRVGGPADRFYLPADIEDLSRFLESQPPDAPLYWIGLGSNLLVRDGGVRGTVIATAGLLNGLDVVGEGLVRAEAGVASAKVARFSVERGLTGAEFLAGIPGAVGGALAMNAGCHGGETWRIVQAVETMDRRGARRTRPPADYRIGYRTVAGPADEWFVAAHFRLNHGSVAQGRELIKALLAKRGASQPTQLPNAGSVFKNPPGDHAARLIEAAGLKGACEGGACVSALHANFIVNTGGATAAAIERLIARVQAEVEKRHGVKLEPEVRVIGEKI
ncbi:MAG: UDP-N-acetylenolpyruvoylglucosamine reductase [Candidatus Muproteobacteria bacterium RIFCSPHIGHO2_02_FULL_65_16]|uniref:UDP-N-acetylenolpyruvoylglucosamine reductase n=1 Tax=Candidatus Muproteobacteria bacterium RIFCSPHIGHO2_02_FULL_65_16 TaxID=1817766 RepID=A0A1F6U6C2_9PROT|nr:MAG: UDP-N-acetylenolpyruvoylglucosamine reductase [Candidatus Muproteobacteria bacterium RIFCSPHIGHO2_02_FULL_65_16]